MSQDSMTNATPIRADDSARRTLDRVAYERFLPIVRRIAIRLARRVPKHITVADLVAYGWVGLMEAYRRADLATPPWEFEAYASYRIRGAMLDHLRTLDPETRGLRRTSRRHTQAIRELTARNGRPPEEKEIADTLGVDLDGYGTLLQRISARMAPVELLDLDQLEASEAGDDRADEAVGRKQQVEAVNDAIDSLPPKLQQILALYYQEECTLREIGAILGVSESWVSQLHSEATRRLRALIGGQ